MGAIALFTDVSLNPRIKSGMGAGLILPVSYLLLVPDSIQKNDIISRIKYKRFEDTSSTKLEVETILWALDEFRPELKLDEHTGKVIGGLKLYTDSQCIAGLTGRRAKLEAADFRNRGTLEPLNHASLYRAFYKLQDELGFEVVKVTGHSKSSTHDATHRIFSYLDREVRHTFKQLS